MVESFFRQIRELLREKSWLWMPPLLFLATLIALANAQANALWYDEIYTNFFAGVVETYRLSVLESVILIARTHTWPPLYYLTFRFWHELTGDSVFTEVALSTFYGLISIAIMYCLGKRLFGRLGGLIAAVLLGTSAFFAYYLHEIRGYTLLVLSVTLVIYMYWRLLHERNFLRKRWSWGFTLSVAFALYVLSASGVFLLGILAYHFFFEWPSRSLNPVMNSKRWWTIAKAWFNGCLIFSPWLGVLYRTIEHESSIDRSEPFLVLVQQMLYLFSDNLIWLAIPLLILSFWYAKRRQVTYLWLVFGIGFVLLMLVNAATSFMVHPRHAIGLLPIFIVLLTAGFLQLEQYHRSLAFSLVGLWVGVGMVYSFVPAFMDDIPTHERGMPYQTYTGIQSLINTCVTSDDSMVFSVDIPERTTSQDTTLLYYFGESGIQYSQLSHLVLDVVDGQPISVNPDLSVYQQRIQEEIGLAPQVWLITRPEIDVSSDIMRFDDLIQNLDYTACGTVIDTNGLEVWAYSNSDSCAAVVAACQP